MHHWLRWMDAHGLLCDVKCNLIRTDSRPIRTQRFSYLALK